MPATSLTVPQWLEQTWVGLLVRESLWGFQIVVAIHIVSLAFSVGLLLWFDLRLLGVGLVRTRVSSLYRHVMPWASVAFVSMFATGAMLFTGFASNALANGYFRAKLLLLAAAAVNAVVYHRVTERGIAAWDDAPVPPRAARLAGLFSILIWASVILCGRMLSYTMF